MQLDLAALNPFIKNLDPAEQDKVRAAFAERMFGQGNLGDATKGDGPLGLLTPQDIIAMLQALKDVGKG